MTLLVGQILSRYFALSTQLQVLSLVMVLGLLSLWLCELIIVFVFGIQLHTFYPPPLPPTAYFSVTFKYNEKKKMPFRTFGLERGGGG